jgi:ketosteroid isomerase-like protein
MDTEATRAALDALIAAFTAGDHDRLAACYHDDVDWIFHAPVATFPFAGARRGKAEVFKGFVTLYSEYRMTGYRVVERVVDGDRAALISEVRTVQRATGRTLSARIAGFHRFAGGKLVEYRGFTDSFDAVEQKLGREVPL